MDPPRRTYQTLLPAPTLGDVGRSASSLAEYDDAQASTHSHGGGSSGTDDVGVSDFVKKLYHMLQDASLYDIVSWGPKGDCFIVKNMHEFTNTVLPQTYKHQNFASFVRQLNKYDFHKIKTSDDLEYGEQSCTFRHPDFRADRPEALDTIKRKVAMTRRSSALPPLPVQPRPPPSQVPSQVPSQTSDVAEIKSQIESLHHTQDDMSLHVRNLERSYHDLLVELVGFQKNMVKQDGLMQDLIQYFLQSSRAQMSITPSSAISRPSIFEQSQFVSQQDIMHLMGPDAANTSLRQMNDLSFLSNTGSDWGTNNTAVSNIPAYASSSSLDTSGNQSRADLLQRIQELQQIRTGMADTARLNLPPTPLSLTGQDNVNSDVDDNEMVMPTVSNPNPAPSVSPSLSNLPTPQDRTPTIVPTSSDTRGLFSWPEEGVYDGLQVYTVGHLMPKENTANGGWYGQVWNSPSDSSGSSSTPDTDFSNTASSSNSSASSQKLRVRRSTYVPGWSVPPRVLLVDDDAVSRKLSSKFLQVFGCTIDVAMDGASAVNKMNLEKYDLVLMDIVMPKLDGMAATSLIRQFDHTTPIISMTSNSKPTEIMAYYSSGMNDILPKPFNKEGLLTMLEKHLSGLRELGKTNASIPRQPGAAGTENNTQDEMVSFGVAEDAGRANPLADMGLSDEQYNELLQSIIQQDSLGPEKRSLDDDGNESAHKRARFGV